ncbi:bel12-ag transposon polyprotein [Nephila pilipes]|uniref:Bel12-ag transposon polyprotein n=1 Tax=Nephila pilipes TaxID=299642 RepID=A0A8X6TER1_NEPPI|nr:bel12-ag transposon polyprotein [Nephila pilipes]
MEESNLSIHTFVDASKTTYAACIFLRSESSRGSVTVQLLQARSRIAPMKTITFPHLELMTTVIGARLFSSMKISEIRKLTTSEDWLHISTDQNPVDILSRGCGPKQLQKCKWWQGPAWLQNPKEQWPKSAVNIGEKEDISLNNVSDLDQIEKTNIVLRWRYVQKFLENLKQRFKREYLSFLRSSITKREDKINVGDIVLIGTDDKKRLHWLLGRVLELFPAKDGIIRLVKLRTERGNILRPIQRLYPLELKPNYEQVVSENRKVQEVVTEYPEHNTDSNKTVPVTSSG